MKKYLTILYVLFLIFTSMCVFYMIKYPAPVNLNDYCKCIKEECKDSFISIFINGSIILVPKTNCECIKKICPPEMVE